MNSSYLNMAAGAFLGTCFVLMSIGLVSDGIFHTEEPETEGFAIEVAEAAPGAGEEETAAVPIATLLASADPAAGETSFRKCASCHTVDEGGPNRVGPNLYGVVNRPIASHEGFGYSAAMTEFSEGGAVVWDYEHLNGFLTSPRSYIDGTAMSFAGLTRDDERANVIAYLRTLAAEPAPLPEPAEPEAAAVEEGAAEEGAAPAEGATEEAPAGEEAPAAEAPAAEDGAAEAAPATEGTAPVEQGAGDEASPGTTGDAPAEAAPAADEAPAAEEPAEAAPAEAAPAAEEAPAEEAPAAEEPTEAAPEEQPVPAQ